MLPSPLKRCTGKRLKPRDVPIPHNSAFAPLNSTEIIIAWGMDYSLNVVEDILTFDTTTCEFKKEIVDRDPFWCHDNRSANVCENTIIAIV